MPTIYLTLTFWNFINVVNGWVVQICEVIIIIHNFFYFISFSSYIIGRGSNACEFQGVVVACDGDDDDDKNVVILKQLESTNNSICYL
jgi:hypothetical protein